MITAATLITELQLFAFDQVTTAGVSVKQATECSRQVFICLYENFKTRHIYIPSPVSQQRKREYQAIYADFTGDNHQALAIKYRRSLQSIYKVVESMRQQYVKEKQHDMFPCSEDTDSRPVTIYVIQEYLPPAFQRAGLDELFARTLAERISEHACERFPGVMVSVAESLGKKANPKPENQSSLFDD